VKLRTGVIGVVAATTLWSCGPPPPSKPPVSTPPISWQQVGSGITEGISGLAPAAGGWLVARDNKGSGQNRISMITGPGRVAPMTWPGTPPQDLESLAAVPGAPGRWAALTSGGDGTIFSISGSTVVIQRRFAVPSGNANIESLAFTASGATVIAVWSTRGSSSTPAKVHAATFEPTTGFFGRVATGTVSVPYPTADARHVSDLATVGTRLVVSSASDPGPDGPYDSALYDIGAVTVAGGRAVLTMQTPRSLGTFPGHKIEGIACSGTAGLLGTDDENQGGWVRSASFCAA
jgi:hypothetical protein